MSFKKATRKGIWVRFAIMSPSGGGKTWTALTIADKLAKKFGYKIAVLDTERGSASKYASHFDFDVLELYTYEIEKYMNAIKDAEKNGYKILIIDSLTHAWAGQGGLLDKHTAETLKSKSGNSYMAWAKVTPLQNKLIDAMLGFDGHLIATMRTKTEYVLNGTVPKKVGMAPVQRDGMEYEFDIVGDMDIDHNLIITKTRCHELADKVFKSPGKFDDELTDTLIAWVGDEAPEKPDLHPVDTSTTSKEEVDRNKMLTNIEQVKIRLTASKIPFPQQGRETRNAEYLQLLRDLGNSFMKMLTQVNRDMMQYYPVKKAVISAQDKYLGGNTPEQEGYTERFKAFAQHLRDKDKKE